MVSSNAAAVASDTVAAADSFPSKLEIRNLTIRYGNTVALRGVDLAVREHEIFGIIGPANAGKTSLLKAINRMDVFTSGMKVDGEIRFNGRDTSRLNNVYALRSRIGVVFPLPVGLPMTVYDNVALSPRLRGIKNKADLDVIVQRCLTRAALWDEVKDRLHALGSLLSGGQQQRLTIARALSQEPDLLMLDEFSIAVDPVTTMRIEDVLKELRQEVTILLVTNLVQQARRLANRTAFFLNGECVEVGVTEDLFTGKVKDQLKRKATELSLEEQQKLCIARLLPVKPKMLLMDEPCSALDPKGTEAVEELLWELRGQYTILIVTHNMAQARRASEECVFMLMGRVVEHSRTDELFVTPAHKETADYIEGRYG